ncbi:MAG TPA: ATP-binding cassette domain-containing protein, partial [Methylomirabilota bacterium]|nr:ATP-binding cassette domain-containing protein [Methylomirabilota bacterium]
MLQVQDLAVDIQASHILRGVTLEVGEREVVCLVGRNGAGKTTTLRTIMGYRRPVRGVIAFRGRSLVGLPTHRIAGLGLGFSPEESEVFGDLTVAENIEIATWVRPSARPAAARVEQAYAIFP